MSDMGDYYRDKKEHDRTLKSKRLKSNSEIVLFLAGELGFDVTMHSEVHFSLFHPDKGRMDYWPSTRRAVWFLKNKPASKSFVIQDIEAYIFKHFKP